MTELEKIGLIPRSIVRMLDRFYYQIYLGTAEPLVKQFRFSKYLLLTSVKSLFVVLFIPFFINIFTKIYVFRPLVEYFWDRKQTEIFLNYELQEKAFSEIRNFEEKMYFDYLIKTENFFPEKPNYEIFLPMQKKELLGVNLQECKFKSNQSWVNSYSAAANSSIPGFENENCFKLSLVSLSAPKYPNKFIVIKNEEGEEKTLVFDFYSKSGVFPASEACGKLGKNSIFPLEEENKLKKDVGLSPRLFPIVSFPYRDFFSKRIIFPLNIPSMSYLEYLEPQRQTLGKVVLAPDFSPFNFTDQTKFDFVSFPYSIDTVPYNFNKNTESIFRQKTRELANHYNNESISALTNLLADFMGLIILLFLLVNMKMSLMNTTAFLSESFFSLKDSKKAFLMLLFTDLLVGFHSPRGWEVIFHFLFEHFGLPENHNIIFLLVGTFPVLLDALFKYWIFRHLNRHSPATVATFQAMVE